MSQHARGPYVPSCFWCDSSMFLDGSKWICSSCGWAMPNRQICPVCLGALPEEEGPGGEKVCPTCHYELWPPRDMPEPPKEVWYHPPGMEPYKVGKGSEVQKFGGPPKRRGGGGRKSKRKSPLQQRMDEWRRRNPMGRRRGAGDA